MATCVLIHGAGDVDWFWHLVSRELTSLGHDAVAPDLPCEDESAGRSDHADAVIEAIGDPTTWSWWPDSTSSPTRSTVVTAQPSPDPRSSPRDWIRFASRLQRHDRPSGRGVSRRSVACGGDMIPLER